MGLGIRCCQEHSNGELWIGRRGTTQFREVFPNIYEIVKQKLKEVRKEECGLFWINPYEKMISYLKFEEEEEYTTVSYSTDDKPLPMTDMIKGFSIQVESADDVTLLKDGKPILKISIPEQSTQWNTKLP